MTLAITPLIQIRDIGKHYGPAGNLDYALRSVNLTVQRGEFLAIMGPSGAGKSTLLNILGLLDSPSEGRYLFDGVDTGTLRERDRNRMRSQTFGFVFQQSHVLLNESAAENAALGLRIQGMRVRERERHTEVALARLGLGNRSHERGKNLSGGERQRVALARAIATAPRLILADEPTGALDTTNSARVIAHLRELNTTGTTIIVITHDPEVAAAADRTVSLSDGVLTDLGSQEVWERPPTPVSRRRPRTGSPLRRFWDETAEALSAHSAKPGRSLLLLLAFLLGTGGLVASMGLSLSAANQVSERIGQAGLDQITVTASSGEPLEEPGIAEKISALRGVRAIGYRSAISASESRVTRLPSASVSGQERFTGGVLFADSGYFEVQGARSSPRSAVDLLNNHWGGDLALVGREAAASLGIAAAGPGERIWVAGLPVEVMGIIDRYGRDPLLANSVVLSDSLKDRVHSSEAELIIRTEPGYPAPLAEAIPLALTPEESGMIRIDTVADLRTLGRGVSNDLGTLIGIVSWLLLTLASLSAATAMYLSVQSRSAEIALRRAIGAPRSSIWRMFMLEGLTIGVAGGIAGSAVGLLGVVVVCSIQGWSPTLDLGTVGIGIFAGACTGILASAYPALIAARAQPADAIRS